MPPRFSVVHPRAQRQARLADQKPDGPATGTHEQRTAVGCMPWCPVRYRITRDGTVRPANRPIPPFTVHALSLVA
jgi:hypothetical protein